MKILILISGFILSGCAGSLQLVNIAHYNGQSYLCSHGEEDPYGRVPSVYAECVKVNLP